MPLYLALADPMNTPGLMLAPSLSHGFRFVIMDVQHTEGDRVVELTTPEELHDVATLPVRGRLDVAAAQHRGPLP